MHRRGKCFTEPVLSFEETVGSIAKQCPITNISKWLQAFAVSTSNPDMQRLPDSYVGSQQQISGQLLARHLRQQLLPNQNCKWSNIYSTIFEI